MVRDQCDVASLGAGAARKKKKKALSVGFICSWLCFSSAQLT